MQADDDSSSADESSVPGGPPPDPSTRAWRHPSEIAAAQAAAFRDLEAPRSPRLSDHWSLGSFIAGGAVGALVTVVALVSTTSLLDRDDPNRVEFRTDTPAAVETAGVSTTSEPGGGSSSGTEADDRPAEGATDAGSTTVPAVSSVQTDRWGRLDEPLAGVFAIYHLDASTLLGTGTLVDGVLVTSFSALGNAERVMIQHDQGLEEAVVRGFDEFSDLAVIVPLEDLDLGTGFSPVAGTVTDGSAVRLVANDGQPLPIIVEGHVLAFDQRALTRDGHTIVDTLHTSARVPQSAAGSPLFDDHGHLVGMVIDSQDYLAFGLPAERISQLARQILRTGWPDPAWVGIEGTASDEGVVVTNVDEDGPATRSGLTTGDVITAVHVEGTARPVVDIADLVAAVRLAGVGTAVEVEVLTGDQAWVARLVVGQRPPRPNPLDNFTAGD